MNKELLSLSALSVVIEAMNHYKGALIAEADAAGVPPDKKVYLEECIIQVDNVFDAIEIEYEQLRGKNSSYPAFKELRESQ
jgi:hypothetical protein